MKRHPANERGASLITSILGTILVFAVVFASIELLVTMHRRTIVTGVADDLARRLARQPAILESTAKLDAEADIAASELGSGVTMTASTEADEVVVTVSAQGPGLLHWSAIDSFTTINRTVRARIEKQQ